jgi:hypothetical protein
VNDRLLIEVLHGGHETILEFKTNAWLAKQPVGCFQFTFTPTHGSLNRSLRCIARLPFDPPRDFRVGHSDLEHHALGFGIVKGLGFGPRFLCAVSQFSGGRQQLKIRHLRPFPQADKALMAMRL